MRKKTETPSPLPEDRLTEDEQARLKVLIEREGATVLAGRFHVAPQTLQAAAGGFSRRRGTIVLVRAGLGEIK